MDKSPDAFRTISEVAVDLDLPQHVLRFWETRFVQIKPLKRGGGRRYYRPDDVELLKGIRHLLYGEGYTIRGVQRILKEQGVRFVMNVWQDGAPQPPPSGARWEEPAPPEPIYDDEVEDPGPAPSEEAFAAYAPPHRGEGDQPSGDFPPDEDQTQPPSGHGEPPFADPRGDADAAAEALAQRFAPRAPDVAPPSLPPRLGGVAPLGPSLATPRLPAESPSSETPPLASRHSDDDVAAPVAPFIPRSMRLPAGLRVPEAVEAPRSGLGQLIDRLRPGGGQTQDPPAGGAANALSRDEIRRLQSTLFELLECKRLLDQVR